MALSKLPQKALQDVPQPTGILPLLGHYLQVRRHPGNLSALYEQHFKDLGPIFRLQYPGSKSLLRYINTIVYRKEHCVLC